jgi:hypothetical protein
VVDIKVVLQRLERAQAEVSHGALQQPQSRDAFEYGRVVGLYAGLVLAKEVIIDLVTEHERKDYDL